MNIEREKRIRIKVLQVLATISIIALLIYNAIWVVNDVNLRSQKQAQSVDQAIQVVGKAANCTGPDSPVLQTDNFGHWFLICGNTE